MRGGGPDPVPPVDPLLNDVYHNDSHTQRREGSSLVPSSATSVELTCSQAEERGAPANEGSTFKLWHAKAVYKTHKGIGHIN